MTINLEKSAEKIGINLEKKGVKDVPAVRVGLADDVSGSTEHLYKSHQMQQNLERLFPVALRFDDNGELDSWAFDTDAHLLPVVTRENYSNYCTKHLLPRVGGGTKYSPVLNAMMDRYYRGTVEEVKTGGFLGLFASTESKRVMPEDADLPACGMLVTDGGTEEGDKGATERVLRESLNHNMFWIMVGVGDPAHFDFLEKMAAKFPNVGFIHIENLRISEDELYDQLISDKFVGWLKTLKRA